MSIDDLARNAALDVRRAAGLVPSEIRAVLRRRRSQVWVTAVTIVALSAAVVAMVVLTRPPNPGPGPVAIVTTSSPPSTSAPPQPSTSSTITVSTTTTLDHPPPPPLVWPGESPDRFAAVYDDRVEVSTPAGSATLGIADVDAAVLAGNSLVFSVSGIQGIWVWPPLSADESPGSPSGPTQASLVVAPPGAGTTVRLLDVAIVDGQPSIVYVETDTEANGEPEQLMVYDLASGEGRRLFDMATRRPGLSAEEQSAWIITASVGEEMFVVLFGFGDGTWVEWYDLAGSPTVGPLSDTVPPGTIVDIVLPPIGSQVAVLAETELHQPITDLYVLNGDGGVVGRWVSDDSAESLYALAFDGRWITAARGNRAARDVMIVDLAVEDARFLSVEAWIALEGPRLTLEPSS